MHPMAVKEIVKVIRQRDSEGDCPTVERPNGETLEFVILELARENDDLPRRTLTNLAEALRKVAPDVLPVIVAAHAEYTHKVALRDAAFDSLLDALRNPT